jgi:hypothetical protein|nr:HEPN domain-containing protein [Odoribacter splanchnicus]
MINNINAKAAIDDCNAELDRITGIINGVGSTSPLSGYLTKYSLIRICGTLEVCYKTIIADYYENAAPQLGQFIGYHLRDASMNPTYENICQALKRFDDNKNQNFKSAITTLPNNESLKEAFSVLNRERNNVAHGTNSTLSFNDMKDRFSEAIQIIEILDTIMV